MNLESVHQIPEGSEDPASLIASVTSFEELYVAIDTIGNIKGSQQTYTPQELKNLIKLVESGYTFFLKDITRTYGVRDKITELMGIK
jgi:threonine dehydrogenase-like Zn-dependent dehydrogenase